jgi:hypothetical protein
MEGHDKKMRVGGYERAENENGFGDFGVSIRFLGCIKHPLSISPSKRGRGARRKNESGRIETKISGFF